MPRADPPRLPHGVSLCLEQSLRFLQQLNQPPAHFAGVSKMGNNWRFGAPVGGFSGKPEKPCRAAGPVPFATLRPCAYSLASEYDVRALRCPQTGQWVLIGYMGV